MLLVVGLGNPGDNYEKTRHNIGFRCVDELARRYQLSFRSHRGSAVVAEGNIRGQRMVLAKPQTFMNRSGQSVVALRQWYKVALDNELIVIYDDVDLPFGALRLRTRGGPGTHNGMRSVVALLGTQDFLRIRVGIDPVPPNWDASSYVLGRFSREQESEIPELCGRVADAVEMSVSAGFTAAMNQFNATPPKQPKATTE